MPAKNSKRPDFSHFGASPCPDKASDAHSHRHERSAPRGASLYPRRSREGLEGCPWVRCLALVLAAAAPVSRRACAPDPACPRPEDRPPPATHPYSYPCGQAGNDVP
jgi:hypothetical protein